MDGSSTPRRWLRILVGTLALSSGAIVLQTQETPSPLPPPRIDPKAKDILERTIKALGGPAFLGFRTMTTRGRVFAVAEGATAGLAPFESAVEYPEKRRFTYGKKQPVILFNDGEQAWELDRYGLTRQNPVQIKRWRLSNRYCLENLCRLRIHEPGVLIQDGGTDFVDNLPALVVDIIEVGGAHVKVCLHKATFLPLRVTYRVQDPETRQWEEYTDIYSDYRTFQGVRTPMHLTRLMNGERFSEVFRSAVQYNEEYPPGHFRPVGK